MKNKKKIIAYIVVVALGLTAIGIIIFNNMNKKDYSIAGAVKPDSVKPNEPTIITIEKDPEVDKRKAIRNSFQKYISAKPDGYNVAAFGGISNLKIKVRNETSYLIDNVELQVRYIKTGGDAFKTETVYANNIKANSSLVIDAPESNRGKEVEVNIVAVTSRVLGLCYVSGKRGPDVEDPYLCN